MKTLLVLAASLLAAATPAAAQPEGSANAPSQGLSAGDFLKRVQALMLGGQVSRDSPEFQALLAEVATAGKEVRDRQAADRAAGRPATFCVPADAKAENDLFDYLSKMPAARRTIPFRQAFADYARAKYPCPKG